MIVMALRQKEMFEKKLSKMGLKIQDKILLKSKQKKYWIQGYVHLRFIFAPFALVVSGRTEECF